MPEDGEIETFARSFLQLMQDVHRLAGSPDDAVLPAAIAAHLATDPKDLPVVEQTFPVPDHPNIQLALEELAQRSPDPQLFGLPVDVLHWSGFGLSNLARANSMPGAHLGAIAPAYLNVPVDVDRTLPCLSVGVWLLHHESTPVAVLMSLGDPHRGLGVGVKLEVMSPQREAAVAFLATVEQLAAELNVYRGKILSFAFREWGSFGLEFHALPELTRDDLILPEADLLAIERHTVGMSEHAERLRAAQRHLKRGLLLYGPPGTGKTFSVMYLCSRMPERTTILLTGQAAPALGQAAAIARSLQPSMLVLEDVDLVAMERTMPGMDSNPLLFQLLNEMDGLDEDADVIFVLTTNRVELLEPALSARPGRIDQAVEIRLPDAACRARLLERYLQGMELDTLDLDELVERTDGVSAAFLKELCRRAALIAAEHTEASLALVVGQGHLLSAIDDLLANSTPILRASLGAGGSEGAAPLPPHGGAVGWSGQAAVYFSE